ncbi:amino acid ABC transporter permease (plasmid) [Azospirillum argentinense]|uniref:Amino acid ABC transporter permease n=1 Tax=Azospirillum argentinense TaxID=2970906 RepID=A0A4D8PUW7_9PROT|nr:amino acid ABC transporter permease [Azospirillum argentinense]QCN99678.1 amino acid ABC transporter permease [Azospirillum argentinense]
MREFSYNDLFFLLDATQYTLWLSLVSLILGGVIGVGVCLMRLSTSRPVAALASAIIAVGQGVPPLVLLFLAYFGLSFAGVVVSPFVAASVALSYFAAVYLGEIWRSAIQSIPTAQWEASESLSLSWGQQMVYVIVPQAIRLATPSSVGFIVQLVKNTSLASIVGLVELTRAGQLVNNATFQAFEVFLAVAAIYFCLCYPLSLLSRYLEKRTAY